MFFGILTRTHSQSRGFPFVSLDSGEGDLHVDIMKVTSAVVLLVAVFWSQEWKSVLSDSIIHIGEFLRSFFPSGAQ